MREKANGIYVDYVYDSEGRAVATYSIGTKEDDPSKGKLSVVVYDENGNQTANLVNPVSTETGYKVGADTIVTTQTFDAKGNVLTSTDGEGNVTRYEYDETSRVSKVRLDDKDGENVTSYTYDKTDSDGNITSTITNALGKISETTEDASGRVKSIVDQGDGNNAITTNHQYDENGNQSKTIYSNGDYKTYTYDSKNRLTELHYFRADGTETLSTEYEYDKSDQTTAMKDYKVEDGEEIPVRYTGYQYDGLGNLTGFYEVNDTNKPSAEEIAEAKITCTYDINNNLTSLSYPKNSGEVEKLLYHYNADNWLTSITAMRSSGTEGKLREYSYHTDGKVAAMKDYREFASGGDGYILKTYEYDAFDRVMRMAYTDSSDLNKIMESYEYTYDKNSNILTEKAWNLYPEKEEDRVNETKSYTYDSLGRLKKSVVEKADDTKKTVNYSYDKVGNRLALEEEGVERITYSYNGLNQLVTSTTAKTSGSEDKVSEKVYQYDSNGNEIKETDSVTGEVRENTYDVDNRLSQAVIKKGDTVSVTQRNEYNGEGQRIRKMENEKVTEYFYQDDSVLYTGDGAGEKTSVNYFGLEDNIIAARKNTDEADPAYYLYNKDLQGSTTGLNDAQGKNALSYQYDDFGSTKVFGNTEVENEICYTGGIYDALIGEYYLNARYYDSADGRFLTQDTYRGENSDPLTLHLYSYCANNPINCVDPTGHCWTRFSRIEKIQDRKDRRARETMKMYKKNRKSYQRSNSAVINDQSNFGLKNVRFCNTNVAKSGCGIIAIHNVLRIKGKSSNFCKLVAEFHYNWPFGAKNGFLTPVLLPCLWSYKQVAWKFNIKWTFNRALKTYKYGILSVGWNRGIRGHFVAVKYEKKKFYAYNYFGTAIKKYKSLDKLLKGGGATFLDGIILR